MLSPDLAGYQEPVVVCASRLGLGEFALHDPRRTFAKLAHKGGAGLDR